MIGGRVNKVAHRAWRSGHVPISEVVRWERSFNYQVRSPCRNDSPLRISGPVLSAIVMEVEIEIESLSRGDAKLGASLSPYHHKSP